MPSYALNQLLDEAFFDDVLCQKFLSLDLRDPPESLLSVLPIGYRAVETPSSLSLGANSSTVESGDSAAMACGSWGQHMEQPCPPRSRWKKISFCSERSVSVVEAGMSGHRWLSVAEQSGSNSHCPQPAATSSAQNSVLSSSSSSRYKTELCRTFAESGACKYGGKCQFAHGVEELRDLSRHPKYKTEPCRTFHTIGYCPYGIRCHFVHNNEDDLGSARSLPPAQPRTTRRPPLLRQSISFAGFPSVPLLPELLHVNPFLCSPAVSPPVSADFPEPLSQACPASAFFDPASEPGAHQFQASHDLGSSSYCSGSVHSKGEGCWRWRQQQNVPEGFGLRSRSLSYTSLSDHEGGSGSSACSLSGSESSVFEGAGRRLPIFSQLSVPDDSAGFLT